MFWSINNTSQEYNSLPSGWVRMKLLPRVMEKILISCDGKIGEELYIIAYLWSDETVPKYVLIIRIASEVDGKMDWYHHFFTFTVPDE